MILELWCIAIVALYLVVRARLDRDPRAFLLRLGTIAIASFAAEDSVIHAYGFYSYSPSWSVFLDRVPLMVVLIWPVVIHSAWDLARRIAGEARAPWLGAAIVVFDASLIEPVAVRAGLWSWTEPGIFGVPPIGILGWGIFAGLIMRFRGMLIPIAATHALLVAAWWSLFRWVNGTIAVEPALLVLWSFSIATAIVVWRARFRERVPFVEMMLRVPAAVFSFALLAVARAEAPLVAWACAFSLPYLALIKR